MRQCLACPTQYADELTLCPGCNGMRSARISGATPTADLASGVVARAREAIKALLWDKEWSPNGVRWAGAAMIMLEGPALLALPAVDGVQFLMVIPWMIMICGFLIVFEVGGEWSEWLGGMFCGFQLLRTLRGLLMGGLLGGFGLASIAMLLYAGILGCILGLMSQGYAHPKSPRLIRIIMPVLVINVALCVTAWAMQERVPDIDEDAPMPTAPATKSKNNSPFDQIPEDAGKPPKSPSLVE